MGLDRVNSGRAVPDDFNVVIEIPMNADPIKYEVDKDSGALFVDRFIGTAMHYPCNYGYVPHTLSDDGDPIDVLVITPFALQPGVVVRCRPLGVLDMQDEAGGDQKLLAVPVDKILPWYKHWRSPLLPALQGPGKRQVGQDRRLEGPGPRARAARRGGGELPGREEQAGVLSLDARRNKELR